MIYSNEKDGILKQIYDYAVKTHKQLAEENSGIGFKYFQSLIKKSSKAIYTVLRAEPPHWYLFYWFLFFGCLFRGRYKKDI